MARCLGTTVKIIGVFPGDYRAWSSSIATNDYRMGHIQDSLSKSYLSLRNLVQDYKNTVHIV